jgi:hypothetical protein
MIQKIVNSINEILSRHGIQEISNRDIIVTDESVSDLVIPGKPLSNRIIDSLWSSIEEREVFHYTSQRGAENILNSNSLRLYSILKRYGEDEIESFYRNHNLTAYLREDDNGDPLFKSNLMPNLFYSSFTDVNIDSSQENYFWNCFADNKGARFRFKIRAQNPNFRKIYYEDRPGSPIPLLNELSEMLETDYDRLYLLAGISIICSFYLTKQYEIESEYRMLYKKFDSFGPTIKNDGNSDYIDQKFGVATETGYLLELLEVQSNSSLTVPSGVNLIKRNT